MNDLPLVSIVVVSYNQGKYIRENLDSVKAQTYANIELIVADDASPDDSVEIFNAWLAEHAYPAKRNFHESNTGLATVLNECVEMVTGKYIKFIAADDYLHPESIEKCVQKLEELGEEYGMVFTDVYAVDDESNPTKDIADYDGIGLVDREIFRKNLRKGNQIAALSVLMKLHVLKETGPYHSDMIVEDYQKWLQINDKYYIAYIPQKLCYYRLHESNISIIRKERIDAESLKLMIEYDYNGELKEKINDTVQTYYYKEIIFKHPDLAIAFLKYPFRKISLATSIKNKLPFFFFRILDKLPYI